MPAVPPAPAEASDRLETGAAQTTQARLDARYGRTTTDRRRSRIVVIGTAIAFVVVFAAWVIWGGLSGTNATLEVRELGYLEATENSIEVRWEVTVEPGAEVSCALQALNSSFGIVGWRVVELEPSESRTRIFQESVRTAEPPVTGLPYRCWLP